MQLQILQHFALFKEVQLVATVVFRLDTRYIIYVSKSSAWMLQRPRYSQKVLQWLSRYSFNLAIE